MLAVHHFNHWGNALVILGTIGALNLLVRWYWREAKLLWWRMQRAERIRQWRERMTAMVDKPFHMRVLTAPERKWLVGNGGLSSDEWFRACAADFLAGRRERMPTCGDYLAEFGDRPKVRTSIPQNKVNSRRATPRFASVNSGSSTAGK